MATAIDHLRSSEDQMQLNVTIRGKLIDQRKHDGTFYSTVVAPAADVFSNPMPFEIRSSRSLGQKDEVVTVECRLGGMFRRTYEVTDGRTGEVRKVKPVVLTLDALSDF